MILYLYILYQKTNTKDIYFLAPIEVEINFFKVLNFDKVIEKESGKMVSTRFQHDS